MKKNQQKKLKNNKAANKDQMRAKNEKPKGNKKPKIQRKTLKAKIFSDAMLSLSCFSH